MQQGVTEYAIFCQKGFLARSQKKKVPLNPEGEMKLWDEAGTATKWGVAFSLTIVIVGGVLAVYGLWRSFLIP